MKSSLSKDFRKRLSRLPKPVYNNAKKAYMLWQKEPYHPSLNFKRVSQSEPIYSVRIGLKYRAVGLMENNHIYWFWIGPHGEYDSLLNRLS